MTVPEQRCPLAIHLDGGGDGSVDGSPSGMLRGAATRRGQRPVPVVVLRHADLHSRRRRALFAARTGQRDSERSLGKHVADDNNDDDDDDDDGEDDNYDVNNMGTGQRDRAA